MKSLLPVILVGLGIFCMVIGLLWPILFPASNVWTEEKALRMTELQNKAHKLLYVAERAKTHPTPGGPSPTEAREDFKTAMTKLDKLKIEFEGIRDSPNTVGTYLRWTGSALVVLGGCAVLASRS